MVDFSLGGDYLHLDIEDGQIVQVQLDTVATELARKLIQDKIDEMQNPDHLQDDHDS